MALSSTLPGGVAGRGGLHNEVSYGTDGLGGAYLGGDSHGKHRPRLVGFWLVLDFLSHFASPGSGGAWVWHSTIPKSKGVS